MNNNDILRRLRYTLNINNTAIIELYKNVAWDMKEELLDKHLKREDDEDYVECKDEELEAFLDGLIIWKRGAQENPPKPKAKLAFNNNTILRKLRIAFELRDTQMLTILELGDMPISKSELSAFFRNEKHRNYMPCQSQVLRKFLAGLDHFLK